MTPMGTTTSSFVQEALRKRRRQELGLLTPVSHARSEYQGQDGEVYINTYGRANLLKREFVEESERKGEKIKDLEGKIEKMRQMMTLAESEKAAAVAKAMRLEHDRELQSLMEVTNKAQENLQQSGKLSSVQAEMDKFKEQQSRLLKMIEKKDEKIFDLQAQIDSCESSSSALRQELRQQSSEVDALKTKLIVSGTQEEDAFDLRRRLKALQMQLDVEQASNKQLENQLEDALAAVAVEKEKAHESENRVAELGKELTTPTRGADTSNLELHIRHLQKELESQAGEVSAARNLQRRLKSEQVLKEELSQALMRAERAEISLRTASESQADEAVAAQELKTWKEVLQAKFGEKGNPHDIVATFIAAEKASLQLAEERDSYKVKVEDLAKSQVAAEEQIKLVLDEVKDLKERLCDKDVQTTRHERKISLLQKERDGLQRIIASYDDEELGPGSATTDKEDAGSASGQRRHLLRIKELEDSLLNERAQITNLESDLQARSEKYQVCFNENRALRKSRSEVAARANALEEDLIALSSTLEGKERDLAELKSMKECRVLHLACNPEEQARRDHINAKIELLQAENVALKTELQKLEKQMAEGNPIAPADAVPGRDAAAVAEAGRVVLQKQLEVLEKKESRLKSAFQERISAFRDACYLIFGYRIDMTADTVGNKSSTTFMLKPMHVAEDSSYLAFKYAKSGQVEHVPTPYSESLQREVDMFIGRYKSIPAFTSNLTMDIFQTQTQTQAAP